VFSLVNFVDATGARKKATAGMLNGGTRGGTTEEIRRSTVGLLITL